MGRGRLSDVFWGRASFFLRVVVGAPEPRKALLALLPGGAEHGA